MLWHRTTICQRLPKDFEQKLLNYQQYITNLRKTGNFLMGQMANADERAIYLDMPPNYTLKKKGMKEVLLKTYGCKKLCLTVMLAATADGEKTTTLANFEKEDFTQIRGVSEGSYGLGPGKRMDDGGADVGVAENRVGSQAQSLLKSTFNACP